MRQIGYENRGGEHETTTDGTDAAGDRWCGEC